MIRPQAIIFDWDNTLVDSWPTIHEATNYCRLAMGHEPWTLDETKSRVRLSLREAFPLYYGDRWEEARQIYMDRFNAIHIERMSPLPGCLAMLEALAGEGIYLGVVSNKTGPVLRREAEHLGWSRFFGAIVGAGDAARDKPAPEPVLMALAAGGLMPGEHVWFVGDTDVDIECAVAAGCVPVLLYGTVDAPDFIRLPPRLRFADASRLFDHIRGL